MNILMIGNSYTVDCSRYLHRIARDGQLIYPLYKAGQYPVWRDQGYISLGIGRFAAGLLWYKKLAGNDIWANPFADFDEPIASEDVEKIKAIVSAIY